LFLLLEVVGYEYFDIAAVVGKSPANCRQILTRARRRIADGTPRSAPPREDREQLAGRFAAALGAGDVAGLEELLAADVVFVGDGGGRAPAIQRPMHGATAVARFLLGLVRAGSRFDARLELVDANGDPALVQRAGDGALLGVLSIEVDGGRIVGLRNVLNPEKLAHLGRVGDLQALLSGGR
jgi:RNA polymerase sigma-70 factor (ECF subfamily)